MRLPEGFTAGAVASGIKPSGRPDLALVRIEPQADWAYVATTNRAAAPCVGRGRRLYAGGAPIAGLIVNAGNANCATGERGVADDRRLAELAARRLGLAPEAVLTASTGVIGVPLPVDKVEARIDAIELGRDLEAFAEAILTTDTRVKLSERPLPGGARVVGVAKGSGMIHPNMATMLAYLFTDAAVDREALRDRWPRVVGATFNQVTVDGDTSTNDMAVLFASGRAGPVSDGAFWEAVHAVARDLARQIARDGEGAQKLITVRVRGAVSEAEARVAARAVAASALWKAAVHGNDPNWGRILVALGYSGARFEPERLEIRLQETVIYDGGAVPYSGIALSQAMQAEEVVVDVDFREGAGAGEAWGCDLTEGYVKINAEYTT
ncbi:glutamate N-acetyltransferase [Oceanithermus profundus DSM 14977]|uniref:Arginine biosynthesis bifunctional protein ArgJ n=1 Tax=Oceanithermus profundus (strain DSM 14977 / NBRC 100410 / VKM B-2274 / 506) TaxID=670487 RepID=E4U4H9_OCEP5|nr:bifunctional glutamate N-acetyltransferase/amino-acid acetyltransferase ArgJ [Oceanithermus profundus]ADR36972.1 glutamate N-acetyltransferase [Oceanithermus profundus DSM 14977]